MKKIILIFFILSTTARANTEAHTESSLQDFHTYATISSLTLGHLNFALVSTPSVHNTFWEREVGIIGTALFQQSLSVGIFSNFNIGTKIGSYLMTELYHSHYNFSLQTTLLESKNYAIGLYFSQSHTTYKTYLSELQHQRINIIEREPSIGFMYKFNSHLLLSSNMFTYYTNTNGLNKYYNYHLSLASEIVQWLSNEYQVAYGLSRIHSPQLFYNRSDNLKFTNEKQYDEELKNISEKSYEHMFTIGFTWTQKYWGIKATQVGIKRSLELEKYLLSLNLKFE